ncbi:MAG TPA: response regulator, partial [Polyangiaceae bacterium]|nr:response regulator [Polyangiaceae bacterium]
RRIRILLVEDDYEQRRMVAAVLRLDGYEVTELSNGQELLDYMLRREADGPTYEEPDLIVSDVCMPQRDGLAALDQLRAAGIHTPAVLMTAYPEHCETSRADELGALTVLEKPFELDDLRMIVLNLAPRSGAGRHSRN